MDVSIAMVLEHIEKTVKELKIESKVECKVLSATRPWLEDFNDTHYMAARRAIIQVDKYFLIIIIFLIKQLNFFIRFIKKILV